MKVFIVISYIFTVMVFGTLVVKTNELIEHLNDLQTQVNTMQDNVVTLSKVTAIFSAETVRRENGIQDSIEERVASVERGLEDIQYMFGKRKSK